MEKVSNIKIADASDLKIDSLSYQNNTFEP